MRGMETEWRMHRSERRGEVLAELGGHSAHQEAPEVIFYHVRI